MPLKQTIVRAFIILILLLLLLFKFFGKTFFDKVLHTFDLIFPVFRIFTLLESDDLQNSHNYINKLLLF